MRLGKREAQVDERNVLMANFINERTPIPFAYNFDKARKPFPLRPMGNDQWGNCVKVGQANSLLRNERVEQRRTLPITDEQVIQEYKAESFRQFGSSPQSPGDNSDQGLYLLQSIRNWRKIGWTLKFGKTERTYNIAAFGELIPYDTEMMRRAIYFLRGVHMGLNLPWTAQRQTDQGVWDAVDGPGSNPGSWGGHLVYAAEYNPEGITCITWGMRVFMTNRFIERYCDEAYAVVDNFNWFTDKRALDTEALIAKLREIGASGIE